MKTIGELSMMPKPSIYRRKNGELYLKINEQFHVKVKLEKGKDNKPCWLGDGLAEKLDVSEKVEVVQS